MCWVESLRLSSSGAVIQMQMHRSGLSWPLCGTRICIRSARLCTGGSCSNCVHCESVTGSSNSARVKLHHLHKRWLHVRLDGWWVKWMVVSFFLWGHKLHTHTHTHPPSTPRGTSFLPCLHAEIRSQRRSSLVFLGQGRTQTLSQNWVYRPFPPTIANFFFLSPRRAFSLPLLSSS